MSVKIEKYMYIILFCSGYRNSGKTATCLEVLHHLYDLAAGGDKTDSFKQMSAALTAIRAMDTAWTPENQEASHSVSHIDQCRHRHKLFW